MEISAEVIAQVVTTIIGFFIFFVIAKWLFWNSILKTIEERQNKIASEVAEVKRLRSEVDRLKQTYSAQLAEIEAQARQKMQEHMAEGRRIAEEMVQQAREQGEAEMERVRQNTRIEMDKAKAELKDEVVRMTMVATEKIIRERLNEAEQRRQVEHFVEELSRE